MNMIKVEMNIKKGVVLADKTLNEDLETLHLAPTLFYYLTDFYLKRGFLNPYPWMV